MARIFFIFYFFPDFKNSVSDAFIENSDSYGEYPLILFSRLKADRSCQPYFSGGLERAVIVGLCCKSCITQIPHKMIFYDKTLSYLFHIITISLLYYFPTIPLKMAIYLLHLLETDYYLLLLLSLVLSKFNESLQCTR